MPHRGRHSLRGHREQAEAHRHHEHRAHRRIVEHEQRSSRSRQHLRTDGERLAHRWYAGRTGHQRRTGGQVHRHRLHGRTRQDAPGFEGRQGEHGKPARGVAQQCAASGARILHRREPEGSVDGKHRTHDPSRRTAVGGIERHATEKHGHDPEGKDPERLLHGRRRCARPHRREHQRGECEHRVRNARGVRRRWRRNTGRARHGGEHVPHERRPWRKPWRRGCACSCRRDYLDGTGPRQALRNHHSHRQRCSGERQLLAITFPTNTTRPDSSNEDRVVIVFTELLAHQVILDLTLLAKDQESVSTQQFYLHEVPQSFSAPFHFLDQASR